MMPVPDIYTLFMRHQISRPIAVKERKERKPVTKIKLTAKKLASIRRQRNEVFKALERVKTFLYKCTGYPGYFDQDMLDRASTFIARSLALMKEDELIDDVPLYPYLSGADGYYQPVVDSLAKIGITTVSDFFHYRQADGETWRRFRSAWNRRIGNVSSPSFLVHLVM